MGDGGNSKNFEILSGKCCRVLADDVAAPAHHAGVRAAWTLLYPRWLETSMIQISVLWSLIDKFPRCKKTKSFCIREKMASQNSLENIKTLQEEEIEVLQAVYDQDFEDLRKKDVWKVSGFLFTDELCLRLRCFVFLGVASCRISNSSLSFERRRKCRRSSLRQFANAREIHRDVSGSDGADRRIRRREGIIENRCPSAQAKGGRESGFAFGTGKRRLSFAFVLLV